VTSFDVRVFSVDLDQPADVVERLEDLLSPEERDAPASIRIARAATRIVLAETLRIDPASVVISRECMHCGHPTHGRPTVAGERPVSFSLSHSGPFAVVALVDGDVRVGVDIEAVKPRTRIDALAARVLSDDEHAVWCSIDDPVDRLRAFLRAWSAKEAYLKALGVGITTRLRDVPDAVDGWSFRALDVGSARVGALAVERSEVVIRYSTLPVLVRSSGGTAR
jgi:4'-phosphopantetheinyl transferase